MLGSARQGSDRVGPPRIVIAGGGVAALEAVLALRALAGDRVAIDLICPDREFAHRPLSVLEPFDATSDLTVVLSDFCAEHGVRLHAARLSAIDSEGRVVHTSDGASLGYDRLLVAVGARPEAALPGAGVFRGAHDAPHLRGVVDHLDFGHAAELAFVAPDPDAWLVPLYELALLTRAMLSSHGSRTATITVVTAEERPLAALGPATSDMVQLALARDRIALQTGVVAVAVQDRTVVLEDGTGIPADHAVTLPRWHGVPIPGLPHDGAGFVEIDDHARVLGVEDVYAAGDMTAGGPKQGGIASRHADAAAQMMLASLGFDVQAHPFTSVLEGLLLTGAVFDGLDPDRPAGIAPPTKIMARYLAPYLRSRVVGDADPGRQGLQVGGPRLDGAHQDPRATNPGLRLRLPYGVKPQLLQTFMTDELGGLGGDDGECRLLRETTRRYLAAGGDVEAVVRATGRDPMTVRADLRRAEELLGHPLAERQFPVRIALELAAREPTATSA